MLLFVVCMILYSKLSTMKWNQFGWKILDRRVWTELEKFKEKLSLSLNLSFISTKLFLYRFLKLHRFTFLSCSYTIYRHGAHNWEGPGLLTAVTALESLEEMTNEADWMINKADSKHVVFAGMNKKRVFYDRVFQFQLCYFNSLISSVHLTSSIIASKDRSYQSYHLTNFNYTRQISSTQKSFMVLHFENVH